MPDRIIGPLTMIQFVEAVLGGGLAYICYNAFPAPVGILLAILAGCFTVGVVFVKINERPFLFYFVALLKFIATPKQRVWQKGTDNDFDVEIYHPIKQTGTQFEHKQLDKKKLEDIAKQLDSQHIDSMRVDQ